MRTHQVLTAALLALSSTVLGSACILDVSSGSCLGGECYYGECCALACGGLDSWDQCVELHVPCPSIYAPVCGCDGVTYSNACAAHSVCVAVDYEGECEGETCGAATCLPGECCLASCGGIDPAAACLTPPDVCDDIYAPVCGCDGTTYASDCEAHAGCVAIAHQGECATLCLYEPAGAGGCPAGTIDCPVGGPAMKCITPERYDLCCCETCI